MLHLGMWCDYDTVVDVSVSVNDTVVDVSVSVNDTVADVPVSVNDTVVDVSVSVNDTVADVSVSVILVRSLTWLCVSCGGLVAPLPGVEEPL